MWIILDSYWLAEFFITLFNFVEQVNDDDDDDDDDDDHDDAKILT
jgi:hypothetical protein